MEIFVLSFTSWKTILIKLYICLKFGTAGLCDYCASKFAVVGFDESVRNELASQGKTGVKTTVVCPFFINTGMFHGAKSA